MYNSKIHPVFSTMESFMHTHGVRRIGKVFPKDLGREDLDASGSFAREHTNGDLFTWIDGKWKRVSLDDVTFVERIGYC